MEGNSRLSAGEDMICRFYPRGTCRYGDHCKFLHIDGNRTDTPSPPPQFQDLVCKFFLAGNCYYGSTCRFLHVDETGPDFLLPDTYQESFPGLEPETAAFPVSKDVNTLVQSLQSLSVGVPETEQYDASSSLVSNLMPEAEVSASSWALAPEFVPVGVPASQEATEDGSDTFRSYARVVSDNAAIHSETKAAEAFPDEQNLCPFMLMGSCRYEEECVYIHGDICEVCGIPCILPGNERHRQKHLAECMQELEKDMEVSFAVAQSREKVCGVCMETVWDKLPVSKQRFGLLPNCSHIFCLDCIRSWRQTKQFENKIIRSCPECRVQSDFVCPSRYWFDSKEEKEKLIEDYKVALSNKPCRYYKEGKGECPFGNKCFYLHALPDGTRTDIGPPHQIRRQNADGDVELVQYLFWDFLEDRDNQFLLEVAGLLGDGVTFVSDGDLSDIDGYNSDF